jgi:hypothetical protein
MVVVENLGGYIGAEVVEMALALESGNDGWEKICLFQVRRCMGTLFNIRSTELRR